MIEVLKNVVNNNSAFFEEDFVTYSKEMDTATRFRNQETFLLLRFYVKSILKIWNPW